MQFLSLLYAFAAFSYIFIGYYVYRNCYYGKLKRHIHIVFFAICLLFGLWSIDYFFLTSAPDKSSALFWYKLSVPFLSFFPAFIIHFFIDLTGVIKSRTNFSRIIKVLIYIAPILFLSIGYSGILNTSDFSNSSWGWQGIYVVDNFWFKAYSLYYFCYVTIAMLINYHWMVSTRNMREKIQARIIFRTGIAAYMINTFIQIVLPLLGANDLPKIAQIVALIWIYGMGYAIIKYKLLALTTDIAADKILEKSIDLFILVDMEMLITKVNSHVNKMLGYLEAELLGHPLVNLFQNKDQIIMETKKIFSNHKPNHEFKTQLVTKEGYLIPATVSGSTVNDNTGEIVGIVLFAEDKRLEAILEEEILKRKQAEEALLKLNHNLELKVEERTNDLLSVNRHLMSEMLERKKVDEQLFKAFSKNKCIFETSLHPIILLDLKGNFEDLNGPALKLLGAKSLPEICGLNLQSFLADKTSVKLTEHFGEILNKGRCKFDAQIKQKEGQTCKAHLSITLIRDYWTKPSGFVATITDYDKE